jgi:branched-subunit amino acid ABC-type transport system permease component
MLPYVIAGLTIGSVYGLAGVGLVLTYKTSGVLNFAHGALATISAYVFYTLHVEHSMPWIPAALLCVFVLGPVLGLVFEVSSRALTWSPFTVQVACTVGILLAIQGALVIVYGPDPLQVPQFLPNHDFQLGATVFSSARVIVFAVGALAAGGLYVYFRIARRGLAMRAVVDDSRLLDVAGTDPVAVRRWAWIIGATFASACGLLLVPFLSLDSITLTFLVVAAFGAAALGRFFSLAGTYFGGLAIGLVEAFSTEFFTNGFWSGLSTSAPFLVLFIVLLVAPKGKLATKPMSTRISSAWRAPWQVQSAGAVTLVVLFCCVPSFAGIHVADYARWLAIAVVFLSLGLLVRTSGQVSLCHVSFMAIGACAFSHLMVNQGWPYGAAIVTAGLIAVPIGALLAIPAIRLSGLYLALATFGFGILLQYMFYTQPYMFGDLGLGIAVPKPNLSWLGVATTDTSYYYFVLAAGIVAAAVVIALNRSRLGRILRALADSPVGLAACGTSVNVTRVLVFCISAFLAAIGGVLEAGALGQVGGDSYQPLQSLIFFAVVIIAVGGVPWFAVIAAAGLVLIPSYITGTNTGYWLQIVFGVFAVLYAVTPGGGQATPPAVREFIDRMARRGDRRTPGNGLFRALSRWTGSGRPSADSLRSTASTSP